MNSLVGMKGTQPSGLRKVADLWTRPLSLRLTSLLKHHMQPILKDLVGSFNANSVLTIGDLCPSMFPEVAIHASTPYWT